METRELPIGHRSDRLRRFVPQPPWSPADPTLDYNSPLSRLDPNMLQAIMHHGSEWTELI
ncbi:hypothetical protein M378DRAFT_158208 [Amanita muscaria Koide BX008]|uniref:Uncharacterized protein n=1 Tax=Amanita muscaria (strain Koide BX008) TaxID=946122 RepID=A0A0C2XHI4_AMAMK|nr:hypothetical protein M378DRAFT_158208 [Amanita muscaria Koide BX008]